jgi:hypothetical protein
VELRRWIRKGRAEAQEKKFLAARNASYRNLRYEARMESFLLQRRRRAAA